MGLNIIIFQKNNITNSYALIVEGYNYSAAPATKTIVPFSSTITEPSLLVNYLNDTEYNLIIYDWSKTLNDGQLASLLASLINNIAVTPWDVAYLGKWSDTCSKYSVLNDADYQPFILVNGSDPVGFNAALLTPAFSIKLKNKINANPVNKYKSINYVINEIASEEATKYVAFSPNLFVYDPLYNSVDDNVTYYAKTQECVSFNSQVTPPSDNALTIFWILLIILSVCVILWILFNSKSFGVTRKINSSKELTTKTYDL
jgi:hypothetical protein